MIKIYLSEINLIYAPADIKPKLIELWRQHLIFNIKDYSKTIFLKLYWTESRPNTLWQVLQTVLHRVLKHIFNRLTGMLKHRAGLFSQGPLGKKGIIKNVTTKTSDITPLNSDQKGGAPGHQMSLRTSVPLKCHNHKFHILTSRCFISRLFT